MLLSTSPILPENLGTIKEIKGVVTSEVVSGANVGKDLLASFTNIVGGRSRAYEGELERGKEEAMQELQARAQALGANGIIGISMQCTGIGDGMMLMTNAVGTAVVIA